MSFEQCNARRSDMWQYAIMVVAVVAGGSGFLMEKLGHPKWLMPLFAVGVFLMICGLAVSLKTERLRRTSEEHAQMLSWVIGYSVGFVLMVAVWCLSDGPLYRRFIMGSQTWYLAWFVVGFPIIYRHLMKRIRKRRPYL